MTQQAKHFTVKHEDKAMEVFIPPTGDPEYDKYLEEAEREKTLAQLKHSPPKPKSPLSKSEQKEVIKEMIAFRERKREGRKKYY